MGLGGAMVTRKQKTFTVGPITYKTLWKETKQGAKSITGYYIYEEGKFKKISCVDLQRKLGLL